jgi:hypothetical protein
VTKDANARHLVVKIAELCPFGAWSEISERCDVQRYFILHEIADNGETQAGSWNS